LPVLEIDGLKVTYEEAGDGLPVVFVPGMAESIECFRHQILGLSPNYRVIAYELRPAKQTGDYSVALLASDLAKLLGNLRAHSAAICGHSFGGMVAQELAIAHPDLAAALVLMSSFPRLPEAHPDRLLSWLTPHGATFQKSFGWFRKAFGKRVDPDSHEWLAQQAASISRQTVEAQLRAAQSFDATERLGEIEAPTLVMVGEKEREEVQSAGQMLFESIADTALEVIEGGDHFNYFFRHDLVNAAIDDFLTSRMASIS